MSWRHYQVSNVKDVKKGRVSLCWTFLKSVIFISGIHITVEVFPVTNSIHIAMSQMQNWLICQHPLTPARSHIRAKYQCDVKLFIWPFSIARSAQSLSCKWRAKKQRATYALGPLYSHWLHTKTELGNDVVFLNILEYIFKTRVVLNVLKSANEAMCSCCYRCVSFIMESIAQKIDSAALTVIAKKCIIWWNRTPIAKALLYAEILWKKLRQNWRHTYGASLSLNKAWAKTTWASFAHFAILLHIDSYSIYERPLLFPSR